MIDTQLTENRGLEIVRCDDIHGGTVADFVCLAIRHTRFEPPACQPDGKPLSVVIAAISFGKIPFADRKTSDLAAPMDDGRIEHPSLFQVGDKSCSRLIRTLANRGEVFADIGMRVPRLATEKHLHEPNSSLDQSPGDQAARPVFARMRLVEAI